MGFLSWLFSLSKPPELPKVTTILPDAAKNEIESGRLPILRTDTVFTQKGEKIHYIDKAILLKDKTKRSDKSRSVGGSGPSLLGDHSHHWSSGYAEPVDEVITEQFKGILYVSNKRVIFVNKDAGFDKPYRSLSAITPYSNGIELQYGSTTYSLLVPDGELLYKVFKLVN